MNETVIIRVEGNQQIGHGHFVRCLSVALYIRHKFDCVFAMGAPSEWVKSELRRYGFEWIQLRTSPQFHPDSEESKNEIVFDLESVPLEKRIVLLDGYRFGKMYRGQLRAKGAKILGFSDSTDIGPLFDGVITPLLLNEAEMHELTKRKIHLHTGKDGLIVRPSFYSPPENAAQKNHDLFIYVGQENVLSIYDAIPARKLKVLALSDSRFLNDCHQRGWDVLHEPSLNTLIAGMRSSQHAILPASTIALEYAIATRTMPQVFISAENQDDGAKRFIKAGLWMLWDGEMRTNNLPNQFICSSSTLSNNLTKWIEHIT